MNTQPLPTNERLQQGIEAARVGRENEARAHLIAVLKQDPNNTTAMLWLAFVLPSSDDSIRLLQRVLALDPTHERAKAGIRWARARLGLPPEEPAPPQPVPEPAAVKSPPLEISEESIRRAILLSNEVQQQAQKGAMAHRARRTINPFLGIFLITGALGLMAIGLSALLFIPSETLAAWIPGSPRPPLAQADIPAMPTSLAAQATALLAEPILKSFGFASDTLARPALPPHIYQPPADSGPVIEPAGAQPAPLPVVKPTQLVGPMGPFETGSSAAITTGRLQLAHQPAYPGEKWIEVNVTTQQLTAWEGDKPVMSYIVSTGLPNTPTVLGEFNIYQKLTATLMTGPNYYLPDVPYTMYFYGGYALHGTLLAQQLWPADESRLR